MGGALFVQQILFWLAPTSPPANVKLPTVMFPLADDWLIVAELKPTRPPTLLVWQLLPLLQPLPLPAVMFTAACDCVINPSGLSIPLFPFTPTSPPSVTPARLRPLIELAPSTVTLLIVPTFTPASVPTAGPGNPTFGFAVTETLVRCR